MHVENETPATPRSKLEYLYRDLLIECHHLAQGQVAIGKQIDEASMRIESFTGQLRHATHHATQQAAARIEKAGEDATTTLNQANQRLLITQQHLTRVGQGNVKVTAAIAASAGALGGLVGVLVTTLLLS